MLTCLHTFHVNDFGAADRASYLCCVQWWASLAARYSFMNVRPIIRKCVLAFSIYAFATGISVAIPDKSAKVLLQAGVCCRAAATLPAPTTYRFYN